MCPAGCFLGGSKAVEFGNQAIPQHRRLRELAAAAKVSTDTVARFERGDELKERTVDALRRALEDAGAEFIDENGGGPGVRLRQPKKPSS